MATNNIVLNLLAKDKTKQAFGAVQRGLSNLRGAIFSVQSALIGIGGGLAIRSLIRTGSEVENLGIRFKFLFNSVSEGNKAFDTLIGFAARVPFSLQEIAGASGNLAVVTKNAEELESVLKITGNVAAVTGLDFRQTAEQIQRSFAGGIAAADVFRERGVRALLGFKAGATVTAEETRKRFEEVFGENGKFSKATEVLATTFTGTLSMLSDKLFKFQLETNRAGFFDFIKNALVVINRSIEENSATLNKFSARVSEALINFTKQAILGVARLLDSLQLVFKIIGAGIGGLIDLVKALPAGVRELGIIGFLMLGRRGKILVAAISAIIKMLGVDLEKISESLFGASKDTEAWGKNSEAVAKFLEKVEKNIVISKKQLDELLSVATGVKDQAKQIGLNFQQVAGILNEQIKKDFESINTTVSKFLLTGIKGFSRSLAEAVVLGKDLNMSLKELAQKLLVDILAFTIQLVLQESLRNFLISKGVIESQKQKRSLLSIFGINTADLVIQKAKTSELKEQTKEMERQKKIKGTTQLMSGNPLGFLGFMSKGGGVAKGRPVVVGEKGAELFIPNQAGQITQASRGTGTGNVNVDFTINTIDSRGFDEALVENRGTITAIINNAVNEKGRGNVV